MNEAYDALNDLLVKLFNNILTYEEKALITDDFKDISLNDMHVIEMIGLSQKKNMSSIAKSLEVTVGTLTIAINNLVKKGYVKRMRSAKDRRVVLVSLTEKGMYAYKHHEVFHDEMIKAIMKRLEGEQLDVLVKALNSVQEFFSANKES
ncbi:MAG: MarR family transcriptional regulator [Vallitaleaceae bacterium]|nr:MarR family transcriptional regulator [Vallitaleaceae bacterium]